MANCEHNRKILKGIQPRLLPDVIALTQPPKDVFMWPYVCKDCGHQGEMEFYALGPDEIEAFKRSVEEAG